MVHVGDLEEGVTPYILSIAQLNRTHKIIQ